MKKIGVFVGANIGNGSIYKDCIEIVGKQISHREFGLVYGGSSVGLMGLLADTVLSFGGKVTGVIPKKLMSKEITHYGLSELHVVETIQDRKLMMSNLSDAFIILPGGIGTLEELFEIWNAIKIGLYEKPIGILNIDGYFDNLINFLKKSLDEGFIKREQLDIAIISTCPIDLLNKISRKMGVLL